MKGLLCSCAVLLTLVEASVYGWVWECVQDTGACQRRTSSKKSEIYPSIEICRLVCGSEGNVWPMPQSYRQLSKDLVYIDATNAVINLSAPATNAISYLQEVSSYFKNVVNSYDQKSCNREVYQLVIKLTSNTSRLKLNWDTNEEYDLQITTDDKVKTVTVDISADTVFGARHGIETLLQLIEVYDGDEEACHLTLKAVEIHDKPFYRHRGLLLDSARNYLSVEIIKKNIVAMAMSKMNVLHWHISDSQSFPFVSSRIPEMSRYGAYSTRQVYTPQHIRELISFAKKHGVRIIPEIDGPAHAGSGWQWGPDAGVGNLVVCYNQQPWRSFCIQPPCGQMNPANPSLYIVLKSLFQDMVDLWSDSDVFHMGGDEVYIPCWNSSEEILNYVGTSNRSEEVFLRLWAEYQEKALQAYDSAQGDNNSTIILWTSHLTQPEHIQTFLPKNRYVIQTWVPTSDTLPSELVKLGYKLIISTKDSWYLDHGFWGTTSFYNWKRVYDNKILTEQAVLGGEVCMWGELVDDNNVESRVWPRAAAAGERLWTNSESTANEAENRFNVHNSRLSKRGIKTSAVTPGFCAQSELCFLARTPARANIHNMTKLCANLAFLFKEKPLLERYLSAKQAGFKAVETGFPFGYTKQQVVDAKNEAGIEHVLVNIFTGDVTKGELGFAAIPGKEKEFQESILTTVEYAKALGAKKIHIMSGRVEGEVTKTHDNAYVQNLKYASKLLEKENILGVIEPINKYSVPKYYMNSYEKAIEVLKTVNSTHLKLQLDIFHLQLIKGDITHTIQELKSFIGHVQIAQAPDRHEPNTPGEINYKYVFETLQKEGYDDWIGLEYAPKSDTVEGLMGGRNGTDFIGIFQFWLCIGYK